MKCPYCGKAKAHGDLEIPIRNAKSYGSSMRYFICPKCKKVFGMYFKVKVEVSQPMEVSQDKEPDWGD